MGEAKRKKEKELFPEYTDYKARQWEDKIREKTGVCLDLTGEDLSKQRLSNLMCKARQLRESTQKRNLTK